MNKKIGIIGGGNMGGAIIKGVINAKLFLPSDINIYDIDKEKCDKLKKDFNLTPSPSLENIIKTSGPILLAVKPQDITKLLKDISQFITSKHLIISIAAGISTSFISDHLKKDIPIIRVMPNTPALIGKGMSVLSKGAYANDQHIEIAQNIFRVLGETVILEEGLQDAVTAISGSGPAYFFLMIESLINSAIEAGIPKETAKLLVIQTALGASSLAKASPDTPEKLRQKVTSPGGTTEAALKVFKTEKFEEIIRKAVQAAIKRAKELG
jgi:pyrroline-5-carboxylate reductase